MYENILSIVLIIILIYYLFIKNNVFEGMVRACNNIDNRCYETIERFNDNKEASEMLAKVNNFVILFIEKLKYKYIINNKGTDKIKEVVNNLIKRYHPDYLKENMPEDGIKENTSYIEDKKIMGICLRERKNKTFKFHDINLIKFVVIHELSHLGNSGYGHELDFWMIFKTLLKDAEEFNLYEAVDYQKYPVNYCLLDIDYNPYYDNKLKVIN